MARWFRFNFEKLFNVRYSTASIKKCKYGVNKVTGKCLKYPRRRKK